MSSLGNLYYTLGIKFDESTLTAVNKRLENAGATIKLTPELLKPITDIIPKWVSIDINPNQVEQSKLDNAINGKVMHAEVLPLADKLKSAVVDALKDLQIPLNGVSIPPDKIKDAVSNALSSANFTSVGDKAGEELAKAIKVKVEGQKYEVTVTAKTDKLADTVTKALEKIFAKEQKIKLDRSDIKAFRDELKNKIGEAIKVTPTINLTQEAINKAVEGKVMRIEVLPLIDKLRKAIKDATTQSPAEIEVGVQESKLRNLINSILGKQGFMISIKTVDDSYTKVVQQKLNGRIYTVKIHADAREIANSVQASLMQVQSRTFGLQVNKQILHQSIDDALKGHKFPIQVKVLDGQIRQSVQNALNAATKGLSLGQGSTAAKANQATTAVNNLAKAHRNASSAASSHAHVSTNLGGAMGSNIKIAGELGAAMGTLYSIHAAKEFLSQVIEIGGELEHQKIALETIYGTESKMESLYGQIKSLARQSPFGVMELTKNVKQLSAYGVAYNEVYDTAKRLADISAATSVDIQRLILAFGKTKNRTFLDGLEAKQFAYANIPIYDMLSKKLTELEGKFVSVKDVMGRIKKREIGFDMVKEILWDMTDEGGKFYNMQEKLAGSVKTSWKLVRDNIELMFGEIAEGPVGSGLKSLGEVLQKLTREWKTIGSVLFSGVAVFGVYKTAVMATNAVLARHNVELLKSTAAQNKEILAKTVGATVYRKLSSEERRALNVKQGLAIANSKNIFSTKQLTMAQIASLHQEKALTKDMALRLIATKRINAADTQYLIQQKIITQTEAQRALSVSGLAARFKLLGASIWSSVKAAAAFVFNPAMLTMAAFGTIAAVWQKHSEQIQKAKDATDSFVKKGRDGFEDLIKKSNELNSLEVSKLSAPQIANHIEEMKTTLKDYALTAEETFDKVFSSTNNGKVRSQKEQFEMLRDAVNETAEAYRNMKNGEKSAIFQSDKVKAMDKASKKAGDDAIKTSDAYTDLLKYSHLLDDVFEKIQVNRNKKEGYIDIDEDATKKLQEQLKLTDSLDEKLKAIYVTVKNGGSVYYENDGIIQDAINRYISRLIQQRKSEEGVTQAMRLRLQELQNLHKAQNSAWNPVKSKRQAEEYLQEAKAFAEASEKMTSVQKEMFMDMAYESIGILSPRIREMRENVEKMVKTMQVAPDQFGLTKELLEYVKLVDRLRSLPAEMQAEKIATYEQLDPTKYVLLSDDILNGAERYMTQIKNALIKNAEEKYPELSSTIHNLIESDEFTAFVQLKLQNGWQESFIQQFHNLDEWKQNLVAAAVPSNDIRDELVKALSGAETVSDAAKGLRDLRKEADSVIQNEGAILLKVRPTLGLSQPFNPHLFDNEDPLVKQAAYAVSTAINKKLATENALNAYGLPLTDPTKDKKKTPKGTQKDEFAEAIKDRIKILKEAKKEYEDLAKLIGTNASFEKLKDSPIFEGLKANQFLPEQAVPQTMEEYKKALDELQEKLTAKGLKTKAHRELNIEIEKVKFEIDKKETEDALKLALDKVSKEAERQIADWNLFDKIRKATGNQDLAMSIAFGLNADAETDYPTLVKKQFDEIAKAAKSTLTFDTATPELLKDAPDEVAKAWEDATKKLEQYARQQKDSIESILSEYQSLSDKLTKIDADRQRKIKTVKESDMSDADKAKYIQRINVEADYQKFEQSNDYLRFFNDIYGLTMTEANRIGDLIQLNLNQKLQAGLISIYDYEQQMEKVRKQLEALRNVKSDALTFMTGGVKGLNEKRLREEEGKLANNEGYQKALADQIAAQETLNKAKEGGNEEEIAAAEEQLKLANESLKVYTAVRDAIIKDQEGWQKVADVVGIVNNIAGGMSDAFNTLRDMADSFGFDSDSNAWNTAASVMDTLTTVTGGVQKTLQSLMSGDIGGAISGVFDTLLTPFTIWNKLHDKKLDKMIEKSKEAAQIMQNQYDILEKQMANFLGNAAAMKTGVLGGGYGKQRQLMQGQLTELEKQRQAEIDKKKTDNSVVEDYNQQIEEMKIQIRDFALEVAKDLYGIDLNGWAEQLGDSLVDAFAAGEDAAEAFDKTVSDIMRDVTSKMISQDILAPMFGDLRNFLFGTDGMSGAFGADFKLDPSEMGAMKEYLDKIKYEGIPAAQDLFDAINNATGGLLNDTEKSKNGATAGLQSLTENTGDLLASYLNGVRGDVSVVRLDWDKLVENTLPEMNIIAEAQLTAQRQIAENTLRTAEAAEAINSAMATVTKNQDRLERSWRRIAEKNWGTY